MKYKANDKFIIEIGMIDDVGWTRTPYKINDLHFGLHESQLDRLQPYHEQPQPVWRDGAVEQPHLALGDCVYFVYKTHIKSIITVWAGQGQPTWEDVYWLPADEFPMPAMPEPVIEPCPFCGHGGQYMKCENQRDYSDMWQVRCGFCWYHSTAEITRHEAISAHNTIARKARA